MKNHKELFIQILKESNIIFENNHFDEHYNQIEIDPQEIIDSYNGGSLYFEFDNNNNLKRIHF